MKTRPKKWFCMNLEPLKHFLFQQHPEGASLATLAPELGMSCQGVSALFNSDNTHLSKVEDIARRYGYELELEYRDDKGYPIASPIEHSSSSGNLYGLEEYCSRSGKTLNAVASSCGIKRDTLAKAIATGDIMVDTLNEITRSLGITVIWNFRKNK